MDNTCLPDRPASRTSGLAIASLVLSLLTPVLGPFGCVPAIVCGHLAKAEIRKDPNISGGGIAQAGLIVGYVFLVFVAISLAWLFGRVGQFMQLINS